MAALLGKLRCMRAGFMSTTLIFENTETCTKQELKYWLHASALYHGDMLFSTIKLGYSLEQGLSLIHFSIFGNWHNAWKTECFY